MKYLELHLKWQEILFSFYIIYNCCIIKANSGIGYKMRNKQQISESFMKESNTFCQKKKK